MNTSEIQRFLDITNANRDCKMFVCAIDKLGDVKMSLDFDYGFVLNLSHSSEPGSHWIGLYMKRGDDGEYKGSYYDSYGFAPKSFYLQDFINMKCSSFLYNDRQTQQLRSKVCGMYASCFILHMSNNGTLLEFKNKFSKRLLLNDIFIQKNYNYMLRNSEVRKCLLFKKQELEIKRKNLKKLMLSFVKKKNVNISKHDFKKRKIG